MKIQKELYDIIEDAINLESKTIVKMMNKHIKSYNSKNRMYNFTLTLEEELGSAYKFVMSEKQSYRWNPVYKDVIPLREIIRNKKLDSLLG